MTAARKKRLDPTKEDVIHIRTAPQDKQLIEKAADNVGLTISSFILQNAIRAARKELSEVEKITLTNQDAKLFLSAITNKVTPNEALRKAFKDYDKQSRK